MIVYDNCALFIGVADYSAFDASLGHPRGTSDLPGAGADALAFFRICENLGIPAENTRILTSPRLDAAALGGIPAECLGDATHASILSALEWLAGRLASSSRPPGLLTYAGHGDYLEGPGLVICPSDTMGATLQGAIPFSKIQSIFQAHRAMANLTVILDTCHSGAAKAGVGRSAGSLSGRTIKAFAAESVPKLGDRVIAACEADQLAWRGRFSGVTRGVLSWAVASTLEQWASRPEKHHVELDLSYGELLERTKSLLAALSFEQTPVLRGRPGTAKTPFFHAGPGGAHEQTSHDPNVHYITEQIGPDVKVLLTASWYSGEWPVVSVGTSPPSGSGYNLQTEYWALDSAFLTALSRVSQNDVLTSTPTDYGAAGQSVVTTNPRTSLWTKLTSTPTGNFFVGTDPSTGKTIAIGYHLTNPGTGQAWTGDITWYAVAATDTSGPSGDVFGSDTQDLTYGHLSSPGSGNSWFILKLAALIWPGSTSQVSSDTSAGAAMTTMGSTLYLVHGKSNGHIHEYTSTDGVSWSGYTETGVTSSSYAPALSNLSGALYLVYNKGNTNGDLAQVINDGSWGSPTDTGAQSSGAPALATVGSVLCLAYQTLTSSTTIHTRVLSGGSWTSGVSAGTSAANGPPSLASFGGSLYMAFPDTSNNIQIYKATSVSSTGITWPTSGNPIVTLTPPSGSQWQSAGLSVWQSQLALTYKDSSGNVWACFSSDGTSWSGYQNLTSQISTVATNVAAAAGVIGSKLVLAFNGTATSATGVQSIATKTTTI